MSTTQTLLTFEEFEGLPRRPGKRELLRGELIEVPPAEFLHNEIAERIWERLKAALAEAHGRGQATELGSVHHEMGYKLPNGSYLQPDVSITHAGQPVDKYLTASPALAVEVISPSNRADAMEIKIELYFQFGAREVWRVYPKSRHVVVHFENRSHVVRAGQTLETSLLTGFSLKVAEILG